MYVELNGKLGRYVFNCQEVRKHKDEWLKQFREKNGTETVWKMKMDDKAYNRYKDEIEEFLMNCHCND